jgi:hypothetical protein
VEPGVTKVYDRHSYAKEKREALESWGRRLMVRMSDLQVVQKQRPDFFDAYSRTWCWGIPGSLKDGAGTCGIATENPQVNTIWQKAFSGIWISDQPFAWEVSCGPRFDLDDSLPQGPFGNLLIVGGLGTQPVAVGKPKNAHQMLCIDYRIRSGIMSLKSELF